jgi:4'-phosphopantetheinyl transferase
MSNELLWQIQQPPNPLDRDTLHLWRCRLVASPTQLAAEFAILNTAEQQRAKRFVFREHQQRFILAHSFLRQVISYYTQQSSNMLEFTHDSYGKPHLAANPSGLEFNLSHSHDTAVIALRRLHPIGVDIEGERRLDIHALAQHHFSTLETQHLFALTGETQKQAFFRIWTQKEAFVKALGHGLSFPLTSFSVQQAPPGGLLQCPPDQAQSWQLQLFDSYPGFQAAFATPVPVKAIEAFNFIFT